MPTQREKRLYPRAEVRWSVVIPTGRGEISCETVNITADGALLRCEEPLRSNEVTEIVIDVPSSAQPLALLAQVVHANIPDPGAEVTPCEIGVRFIEISDKNRWLIATAVQRESGAMLMP